VQHCLVGSEMCIRDRIRRIMVNTSLNYIKKHSKYKYDFELDKPVLYVVGANEPEIKMNQKDLVELIRKLPSNYQTIFNLVAIEGYNQMEIAKMLDTNINTIRSQYSRGRTILMKMIEDENKIIKSLSQ
jgi:RNA polymerase sigma factor (sigma-70 family)